jgi:hypothetical protein
VTTFCACFSPAPTRVKTKPAPAIHSQESVHTTLSITHHTRKRPSNDPRTTHGPHILSPLGLYGGKLKSKIPLRPKLRYTPPRELWEFVFIAPSDGCPATALRVASTQALGSRRVSSALKLLVPCDPIPVKPGLQTGQAGFGEIATLGLQPRLCGSAE